MHAVRKVLKKLIGSSTDTVPAPPLAIVHEPIPEDVQKVILEAWDKYEWYESSDALTKWLNARWKKTGFKVSKESVYFTLRLHMRDAKMHIPEKHDKDDSRFARRHRRPPFNE